MTIVRRDDELSPMRRSNSVSNSTVNATSTCESKAERDRLVAIPSAADTRLTSSSVPIWISLARSRAGHAQVMHTRLDDFSCSISADP